MQKFKFTALLLAVIILIQCWFAASAAEIHEIQFFTNSSSNTFSNNIRNTMLKRTKALKIKLNTFDANRSQAEQNKQFRTHARTDVPAIVDLVDSEQSAELLEVAKQLKVTTIFINEVPNPEKIKTEPLFWYVGNNNSIVAHKQGQMIVEYVKNNPDYDLNGNGVLDIMLLHGGNKNWASNERTKQIKADLEGAQIKYSIKYDLDCGWSYEQAFNQISNKFATGLNDVDIIIAHNDDMALGAISALQDLMELEENIIVPPAFGVGATSESINALAEGDLTGTVRLDFMRIADVAVAICLGKQDNRLLSNLAGEEISSHFINVPCNIIISSKEKTIAANQD